MINTLALAVALAMDAFAVSIASGVSLRTVSARQTFRLAWHFGLFQAMMPVIGWSAGFTVRSRIEAYDHWVAFALLVFVAQGMLRSAFKGEPVEEDAKDPTKGMTMVMLSVATSIDALAVGLSLSMINVSIWTPALIIGLVAGVFTTVGMHLGKVIGSMDQLSRWAEMTGGIVLLAIGVNILREHGALSFLF
ncbi:manganese efflux pump MntP family protein [Desulfosarcina sp.]|uniref:manganese efflux pump MntP n=1 Tax=Desulfosarcina sp. TaxID=2027861 RepID=UPI0029B9B24A|nr:manganese efflux pump MntP family protein [Desulfosarcina sp.]MDX2454428.1 manganese efflux pump MntP family protein [Desulfosarcina sp.]MDX2492075.1 manganese efflux pump MntP family protein [Desulfosarcina sp.]